MVLNISPFGVACLSAMAWLLLALPAGADVVTLEGGGQLRGEVVREGDLPRSVVALESPWGRIVVDRRRVEQITTEKPGMAEYRRRAPTVSDRVESQLALALWCRDHGLGDQLRLHLERVVQLDPDHEQARSLLGYQRVDGQWKTRVQLLASRGLERYNGAFRTRQEIALLERELKQEETGREWRKKLSRWRHRMESNDLETARTATEQLATLDDPASSGELVRLLFDEERSRVKLLLIRTCGAMDLPVTLQALARLALTDHDPEIRAACVEQLAHSKRPGIAGPFVTALTSQDNGTINRAGDALAILGDTTTLKPLIEALVTTHKTRVGSDSGGDTYSLNTGTGQHSFGGGGAKIIRQDVRNPRVLDALVHLTEVNLMYDEQRWRDWLAGRQAIVQVDLRRDE